MKTHNTASSLAGAFKYAAGFFSTLVFRLVSPFLGLWNVSPLLSTELAGSKAYGPIVGGLYGALSMALLDLVVGRVSLVTLFTSVSYGAVGVWAGYFLRNREASAKNFIVASVIGTLFFDIVTGVVMGPMFFGQSWSVAALGQIPFTVRHLAGNVAFAAILAPWFYRRIMNNPALDIPRVFRFA